MTRKGSAITLSLQDYEKAALAELAQEFGLMWGEQPNISKLIKAIAQRELLIGHNQNWSMERIQALFSGVKALADLGQTNEAQIIAQLLLERSEPNIPWRTEISKYTETPLLPWRQKIDEFLFQHQPFRLSYRDAMEREVRFTVLYGEIRLIEKRQYLACQCVESEDSDDVTGLQHNWFLRLDRIQDALVIPTKEKWEKGLETILVEFQLTDRLAFAYEQKPSDVQVADLASDRPTKSVKRQINSTFWFFREIWPYGADCEIIAPLEVRDRFAQQVKQLAAQYQ
jgi:predicted DNA-binding transcriptional regulator YafY